MKKELKIIPVDSEHGVLPETTIFRITSVTESGKPFIIGSVSKKINGWHWHALGRAGRSASHQNFECAAHAAQRALGSNIQFEEVG